ncbi:hypothetical protein B0H10DRAFT_2039948 [Mycena sp. CBHHK59/15]|nr:hypothetical protein B0H10DRAFT_2039948 [Mycena sp. CBHHK59/15]
MEPYAQAHIEQDRALPLGGDDLPTYDDLAAQEGPNSRWELFSSPMVETLIWRIGSDAGAAGSRRGKRVSFLLCVYGASRTCRAAERYMSVTPEERTRRRERGWGNDEMDELDPELEPQTPPVVAGLTIQTKNLRLSSSSLPSLPPLSPPLPPLPAVRTRVRPAHLQLTHFGSRFLPHAPAPVRCLLPLPAPAAHLLLLGTDEGLAVLDVLPQEWNDAGGLDVKGPEDAAVRAIWLGESVFQMSILEVEHASGVVLLLVGPEPESPSAKDTEGLRTIRMYNLTSLISLAKWAVANKHRARAQVPHPAAAAEQQQPQSYQALLTPTSSIVSHRLGVHRTDSADSTWEIIDDLPLRWARDFVPLAGAGSRLLNTPIITFALWDAKDAGDRRGRTGQLLAVATKNNILLYETPQNERAFRFVKEFYTPLQPKSLCFFQQHVTDLARSPTDVGDRPHRRSGSSSTLRGRAPSATASVPQTTSYGTQLSLFVVFEKKASWIRLADSAVGEMALFDDSTLSPHSHIRTMSASPGNARRRHVSDNLGMSNGARWLLPAHAELPSRAVYVLTRGAHTHVVPCPWPAYSSGALPLATVVWATAPAHVAPRVGGAYLQLTALGLGGVEVAELGLAGLEAAAVNGRGKGKGKGKARAEEVRAEADAGGETGFLCVGGHWDRPHAAGLRRMYSTTSDMSGESFDSVETAEAAARLKQEQGIYGWCRKGLADWRVFWVGGGFESDDEDGDEEDG